MCHVVQRILRDHALLERKAADIAEHANRVRTLNARRQVLFVHVVRRDENWTLPPSSMNAERYLR